MSVTTNLVDIATAQTLYKSNRTTVLLATLEGTDSKVVVKTTTNAFPPTSEIEMLQSEYDLAKDLDHPHIAKITDLQEHNRTFILLREYVDGFTLANFIKNSRQLKLKEKIEIAIQITQAIKYFHAQDIINKDINANNLLIESQTLTVKLIDFGIATKNIRQTNELLNLNQLEGTLEYISPEQTGRVNRSIDYRSDLYSLGVVLYQLFTGRLPFSSEDALDLVYAHIALQPEAPHLVNPEIPETITAIIAKLLEKNAEDRYQSSLGLLYDLTLCKESLAATGLVGNFEIATTDFSTRLQIPQKLYGRETQRQQLLSIYEQATNNYKAEVVLISGSSGIGKSSLINELHKPITQNNGIFIKGKFDQLQRNIPYLALLKAFDDLIDQLITESATRLAIWKDLLVEALSINAKVMTNLLPRLELIIGEQPEVEILPVLEAQNRLENTLNNFIKAIASPEHPLCLFIDDLQWADTSSLKFLEIITQETLGKALVIIGAYRDNEIDLAHPLLSTLKILNQQQVTVTTIQLTNLAESDVYQLIDDTLQRKNKTAIQGLAKLIFQKTQGNPFFVNQFLLGLYNDRHLNFDLQLKKWVWDITSISQLNLTENVAEFIADKMRRLPSEVTELLGYAAAIGHSFDENYLVACTGFSNQSVKKGLNAAIQEEIILQRKNGYQFVHDKVQQAAYSLVLDSHKPALHLHIAQNMVATPTNDSSEKNVFSIANQYNLGLTAIHDDRARQQAITYNLLAGNKATEGNAFASARTYLLTGYQLLPANAWQTNYQQTFDYVSALAETAYQNGNFEQASHYIDLVINNAKTPQEKANIYNRLIVQYTLVQDFDKAVESAKTGLALLGFDVPEDENLGAMIGAGIGELMQSLAGRNIATLIDQSDMTDEQDQLIMKLLINAASPCFLSGKQTLWTFIIVKATTLSMQKGNTPESCTAYSSFGILSGAIFSDYHSGYEYGKLAVELANKYNNLRMKCAALFVLSAFTQPWVGSIKETFGLMNEGIRSGVNSGEMQFASYIAGNIITNIIQTHRPIREVISHINTGIAITQKAKNFFSEGTLLVMAMFYYAMAETKTDEVQISYLNLSFDQIREKYVDITPTSPLFLFNYHFSKAITQFFLANYDAGFQEMKTTENYLPAQLGSLHNIDFVCFMSLNAAIIVWQNTNEELVAQAKISLETYLPKLQLLNDINPTSYAQRYKIVQAFQAAITEDANAAMNLFDEAIDLASKNGFLSDYALFYELSAMYYGRINRKKIQEIYLAEAYQHYYYWGAYAKVELLEIAHPFLLKRSNQMGISTKQTNVREGSMISTAPTVVGNKTQDDTFTSQIDVGVVVKASLALASEVVLDKLCETLIGLVVESAGAQKGVLLLRKKGELLVFAEKTAKKTTQLINSNLTAAVQEFAIPEEIINYCLNSRKTLVIDNATTDTNFGKSAYIQKFATKSVLALPLIHQTDFVGIIYLENNLTAGAFTSKRLALLNSLAAQITISVVNAMLYENLEEKVKDRTAKLSEAYEVIQKKNLDITSSINYAKRIQEALLPAVKSIQAKLDAYVFYLPKDIVSGDFYWFTEKGANLILVAADSTGHGVPGALMSMLGIEMLNKIVHDLEIYEPAQILSDLHKGISELLKQEQTGSRDGMDIAILNIDQQTKQVQYAGAMNPLYYIQQGVFNEIKADKLAIAGQEIYEQRIFTNHTINAAIAPTTFYISSDGFQDQFGGEQHRKYMTKRYKEFLQQESSKSIAEQGENIAKEFFAWKGNTPQIDDVLVIGVRI